MKSIRRSIVLLLLACSSSYFFTEAQRPASEKVYVVPFSHLDLFWGGTEEETLSRGDRILSRAMQLAEEHPEFRFLMEDNDFVANFMDTHRGTKDAERLRALVRSGRIEIAPKWAAIYQNLPREEALVRNIVYGKRYARDVFGVDPLAAHLGDIPGFTRQYPQILSGSDVPYMVMTRMGPTDVPLFQWQSPNGSKVLVWDAVKGYGWGVGLGLHKDLTDASLKRIDTEVGAVQDLTKAPVYLGWGTDLFAPNETLVSNLAALNKRGGRFTYQFSTPTDFFHVAEKTSDTPTLTGEITGSWANVNSSASPIWPPAVAAADALVNAEKFAAISYSLGYSDYPQQQFDHLWRRSLEAMDHNFYGQGGDLGDAEKVGFANAAILESGQILRASLRNIAERVKHPAEPATTIVVFNPVGWMRDDVVRAHVPIYGDVAPGNIADYKKAMSLVDAQGTKIPFDVEYYAENMSRALTLVFQAQHVPSLGYKSYYLKPAEVPDVMESATQNTIDEEKNKSPFRVEGSDVLENRFYRVTVDKRTGRVDVFDKQMNRDVAKGMEIVGMETRGGDAISVFPYTGRSIPNIIDSVNLVESGPAETVLRLTGNVAGEPVTQQLTMYHDLPQIDIENTVDWKPGRYMELQQVFPVVKDGAEVRNGVPYGSVSAAEMMQHAGTRSHDEVDPSVWNGWRQIQNWITASTADWSVTISADRQLFTVDDQTIRGDMLRGTSYNQLHTVSHGMPAPVQHPAAGRYTYRYSLSSGKGNWAATHAWQNGLNFNNPLIPFVSEDEISTKTLPAEQSFLSVEGDSLVVSAVKKADRGDDVVVRFYDETGHGGQTRVRYLGEDRAVRELNFLEEAGGGKGKAAEHAVSAVQVKPFEIRTVEVAVPAGASGEGEAGRHGRKASR